jgi:hypothetical protein
VGKKRVRVEVLLAAAASPVPPPIDDLLPDPRLRDEVAEDLPWLLRLLPRADVYLQDEVEIALHPTLTRIWSGKGRRRQRLVEAPGNNTKEYGFGLVDWRDGGSIGNAHLAVKQSRSAPSCGGLSNVRSSADAWPWCCWTIWASTRQKGRVCCARCWTNCVASWCWSTHRPMTRSPTASSGCGAHCGGRSPIPTNHVTLPPLLEAADTWAHELTPLEILRQIGSPFADTPDPLGRNALAHAA